LIHGNIKFVKIMLIYIRKNCYHKRHSHKWWLKLQPHLRLMANATGSFGLQSHVIMTSHK
jgi:hypothetical protein